jgi:hypothetical protein
VVGNSQVLVYENMDSTRVINDKMGSNSIKLSVYLPGDEFAIP